MLSKYLYYYNFLVPSTICRKSACGIAVTIFKILTMTMKKCTWQISKIRCHRHFKTRLGENTEKICLIISSAIFDNAKTGQIFAVRNILHTCYIKRDYLRAKPIMHAPNTFHPLGIYPQIMIWKLSRGVQIRKPLLRTVSGQIGDRSPNAIN